MKKLLLVLLLSSISSLNAMSRFLARNSTDYTVTLAGKTLQPHEQIELNLNHYDNVLVEAENNCATPINENVGLDTKLFDITKRENSSSHIHTHQLVVTKKQTRPLIIIKKCPPPLLVTEVNDTLPLSCCQHIPCHSADGVSVDLAANTEQIEIQDAYQEQAYDLGTNPRRLIPTRNGNREIVHLARNATGLEISPNPDGSGGFRVTQLKHVEIIRGIKESE